MNDFSDAPPWVCVQTSVARRPLAEASLVLTAVGIDSVIVRGDGEWRLLTVAAERAEALRQLARFRAENTPGPGATPVTTFDSGWPGVCGFLLILWLLPALEGWGAVDFGWRDLGRMEAGRVLAGEWHRVITALTLHGDLAHLIGNSLFGVVFGVLLGRYFGSGFGWLLVLACGALGNVVNAWLRPAQFLAVGASTALFAMVGLIGAFAWRRGHFRGRGWRRTAAPLFAAVCLLALTGMGGANADVLGHVAGFCCGAVTGALIVRFDLRRLGRSGQGLAGALAVGMVAFAWLRAA